MPLKVGDRVMDDIGQYGVVKDIEPDIDTFWIELEKRPNAEFPYPPEDLKKVPSEARRSQKEE